MAHMFHSAKLPKAPNMANMFHSTKIQLIQKSDLRPDGCSMQFGQMANKKRVSFANDMMAKDYDQILSEGRASMDRFDCICIEFAQKMTLDVQVCKALCPGFITFQV